MTRAKVMTGSSGFDLIEQGALYLNTEIASNALIKLDKSKLPNLKYRNKAIYDKISKINDPGNKYAVVYTYGTTGLAYNKEQIEKRLGKGVIPNSWEYVFNAKYLSKISDCGVSLLDEPEQIFGNYFFYHGIDPNTNSKAEYEKAALDIIRNIRPHIKYFDSNKYQNDFTAGNLCLVMGYSGDVVRSVERAKTVNPDITLAYVIPKEGTNIWFDMLMIPKDAKNLDDAYALMNYIIDPYVSAQNSNYIYQPNAVTTNDKYLDKIFDDTNIRPSDEMIEKMYVLNIHDGKMQSFISRMWMNVKYGIKFKPKYYKPSTTSLKD
jgi:putrescine transport system substrate-binding protein